MTIERLNLDNDATVRAEQLRVGDMVVVPNLFAGAASVQRVRSVAVIGDDVTFRLGPSFTEWTTSVGNRLVLITSIQI